jgi:hypothetical protein
MTSKRFDPKNVEDLIDTVFGATDSVE